MTNRHPSPKFKDYGRSYFNSNDKLSPADRNELIVNYTPLIKYIAFKLAARLPQQVSQDDLISCGIIGLIDAIAKFNPSKNVQFKTYAEFRIKGAMLDELRALDWVPRSVRRKVSDLENTYEKLEKILGRPATDEEVAQELDLSLDEFYKLLDETKSVTFMDIDLLRQKAPTAQDEDLTEAFLAEGNDPYATISLSQLRDLVARAIDELPHKEKLVVSLYYYEELTMKEIGHVLSYTESRISQMHSKAILRLRTKMKKALST